MKDLLNRIMMEQESFPAAQRLAAECVLKNCHRVPFMSISALAKEAGVSESTVVKFCAQLGFDGYAEFKRVFSEYVHSEYLMCSGISNAHRSDDGGDSVFDTVMREDTANIEATLHSESNAENLSKLLSMIEKAEHIYTFGSRSSFIFGEYLANNLRHLGIKAHTISGGVNDCFDRTSVITPDDLVITFCFPRYSSGTIDLMKDLHERGIPQALITDTGLSPAYPFADAVFQCSISSDAYFLCYTSCMSLLSVICRAAAMHFKDTALAHASLLEKKLISHGVFVK